MRQLGSQNGIPLNKGGSVQRFGMLTRTELIMLQRTMVVVEGVARSLNPALNMWEAARPVVTDYIRANLGPAAVAREIATTLRILSRVGPRLPQMAEAAFDPPRGRAAQLDKDLKSVGAFAEALGLDLPVLAAAIERYHAFALRHPGRDSAAIAESYRPGRQRP